MLEDDSKPEGVAPRCRHTYRARLGRGRRCQCQRGLNSSSSTSTDDQPRRSRRNTSSGMQVNNSTPNASISQHTVGPTYTGIGVLYTPTIRFFHHHPLVGKRRKTRYRHIYTKCTIQDIPDERKHFHNITTPITKPVNHIQSPARTRRFASPVLTLPLSLLHLGAVRPNAARLRSPFEVATTAGSTVTVTGPTASVLTVVPNVFIIAPATANVCVVPPLPVRICANSDSASETSRCSSIASIVRKTKAKPGAGTRILHVWLLVVVVVVHDTDSMWMDPRGTPSDSKNPPKVWTNDDAINAVSRKNRKRR